MPKLPQEIIDRVNRSTTATVFGGMNFNLLKSGVDTSEFKNDDELKSAIKAEFDKDFTGGLELF